MKSANYFLVFTLVVLCLSTTTEAQVSDLDNSGFAITDYLGWDNTTTFPLEIRHNRSDQPIGLWTNNLQRLRINRGNANPSINGFPAQSTAGFVSISPDPLFYAGVGPFSLLHLAETFGTAQETFRPWMRAGLTISGNGDVKCSNEF